MREQILIRNCGDCPFRTYRAMINICTYLDDVLKDLDTIILPFKSVSEGCPFWQNRTFLFEEGYVKKILKQLKEIKDNPEDIDYLIEEIQQDLVIEKIS